MPVEEIGRLWQEGEELADAGELHEALFRFLRAKKALMEEEEEERGRHEIAKKSPRRSKPIQRILRELMVKLNESIEKYCIKLENNPLLALRCTQKFSKTELKKSYRSMILKYHPDKNTDCDTSCIFTIIQAAYESLVSDEAGVPRPLSSRQKKPNSRERGSSRNSPEMYHSSFFQPSKESTKKRSGHSQSQKGEKSDTKMPSEEDYFFRGDQSHQRGAVFGMPSEEIRRVLRALAQENSLERRFKEAVEAEIANCSREELVRRYLKARAQDGRSDAVWERRLRELFRKESKSRGGSSARSQSKQNHEEADKADSLRQQRVGRMKRELPLMSLTELRRMMNTCGIPLTNCLEKEDLLRALCKYYGISYSSIVSASDPPEGANSRPQEKSQSKAPAFSHMTSETLRKVMKSSGHEGFGQTSPRQDSCSFSSDRAPLGRASSLPPKPAPSSAVWTRERIREMERKLNRDRSKRSSSSSKKPLAASLRGAERTAGPADCDNRDSSDHRDNGDSGVREQDREEHVQSEEEEEVHSPRGRFLDEEDSDIDDEDSSPPASRSDSESSGDEIPWRPVSASAEPARGGSSSSSRSKTKSRSSAEEDMEVEIPSLEEIMRSLGLEDDPAISPGEMKAARLRSIASANSSGRLLGVLSDSDQPVHLGVSLLAEETGGEGDDSDEHVLDDAVWRQMLRYKSSGKNVTGSGRPAGDMLSPSATAWR